MDIKGFKDRCGNIHKYDYGSLANIPDNSTVTDQQIAAAVEKYLTENPVDCGSKITAKIVDDVLVIGYENEED